MDIVLRLADDYFLDVAYAYLLPYPAVPSFLSNNNATSLPLAYSSITTYHPSLQQSSLLPRDSMLRQAISLWTVALVGALIIYFVVCSLSYYFLFDRRLEHHPRYIKNQVRLEIKASMIAAPWIDFLMLPWFVGEVRGHSKMYDRVDDYGWPYLVASAALFLCFTDFSIYWVHRLEHHPRIYKHIHKAHHKWISESPSSDSADKQCLRPGPHWLSTRSTDTLNHYPTSESCRHRNADLAAPSHSSSPCTNTSS